MRGEGEERGRGMGEDKGRRDEVWGRGGGGERKRCEVGESENN